MLLLSAEKQTVMGQEDNTFPQIRYDLEYCVEVKGLWFSYIQNIQ